MQHELAKNNCRYRQYIRVDRDTRISGDINSLVQVLDNIIVNAIQSYNGQGGDVSIRVTQEGARLLITVSDSGNGIPEDVKDRLFKEMITTKGKHGTGLGLYMSHSTIKGMFRGDMWFESRVGQGTRFFIQLPLSDDVGVTEEIQDA
jgi:signal transduction histidine kinase